MAGSKRTLFKRGRGVFVGTDVNITHHGKKYFGGIIGENT